MFSARNITIVGSTFRPKICELLYQQSSEGYLKADSGFINLKEVLPSVPQDTEDPKALRYTSL